MAVKRYIYRYTVLGKGSFPMDMLRYDEAWPADTTSALNINIPVKGQHREITLYSYRSPTVGRWVSFGWGICVADIVREEV